MELHENFEFSGLREAVFGYAPEYTNTYDISIFLRRLIVVASAFARAYYRDKHLCAQNATAEVLDRIAARPYISVDNAVSVLSTLQHAGNDLDELGIGELKILADEKDPDFIDIYEVKAVLQDETGKFFDIMFCRDIINRVVKSIGFITHTDLLNADGKVWFCFRGEDFDIGELFTYEYCYLYRSLLHVDPLETDLVSL